MMLRLLGTGGDNTENGKMMSFLSGFSAESMRQNYSRSEKWKNREELLQYIKQLSVDNKFDKLARAAIEQLKKLRDDKKRLF